MNSKKIVLLVTTIVIAFNCGIGFSQNIKEKSGIIKKDITEEKISLDFKGIDIIEVFRVLSLKTGLTIVPSKAVKGRINIYLNSVTFEDALDVILISQGLASEERGDILMIITNQEYQARYGKAYAENRQIKKFKLKYAKPSSVFEVLSKLKSDIGKIIVDEASGIVILVDIQEKMSLMLETVKSLDQPLATEVFDLGYADSADMKQHLTEAMTSGTGKMYIDERTNKIVVSDLPGRVSNIKHIVEEFDAESTQVFIEAEIIQITLKKEYQKGINWQKTFTSLDGLDVTGGFNASPSFTPSSAITGADGAAGQGIEATFGTLATDNYTATIEFLETFGETKILSRPKIAVVNNQEARILVGSREAYVTQTQSQAESTTVTAENVEFIDVGVKLNVTPTIHKDGFVTMKIKPEVSSVLTTLDTSLESEIPIVATSEIETTIKVKDGSLIMLGGLLKEEKRDDETGIPGLMKIPIIGKIFGSKANLSQTTELLIFIKPTIMIGKNPLPGTQVEKFITPDIMPDDIKKSIFSKEVGKIGSTKNVTELDQDIRQKNMQSSLDEITTDQLNTRLKTTKDF